MQAELERLNAAKAKVQQLATEGSRIEGELSSAKKRNDEIESQCQEKFDCPTSGLGSLIGEFQGIATKELKQAEVILGISGGEDEEDTDGLPV